MQPKILAKKIRKNLLMQKEKLEGYLDILENEETDLKQEDPDKLIEHINLEKDIINELNSFKKILIPLEKIYYNLPFKKDLEIFNLKSSIDNLSKQVVNKTNKNKEILDTVLVKIKADIQGIAKKKTKRNTYEFVDTRLVDING